MHVIKKIYEQKNSIDLGWDITDEGQYKLRIPKISEEEKELILKIEERFREKTGQGDIKNLDEIEQLIKTLITDYANYESAYLDSEQTEYLTKIAIMHIYGFCFIDELLEDKNIEEISIIGVHKPTYVYVKEKGWLSVNACFTNEHAITDVVNKMAQTIGRRITLQNPRLDAILPNGDRLHASLPPISSGEITIRRFREMPYSPSELCQNNTINEKTMAYLSILMQSDSSVIIAGNTASGKTTTLNALFGFVPLSDRVIITEETPEINIPHKHSLRLVANKDMGISLQTLVYDSFRMRPDRIIVGEIRNKEEANALFDVLLAGQARGSYATMHAQSANEALQRLKSFGINEIDLNSISCIIVQKRMIKYDKGAKRNFEIRRIVEIAERTNNRHEIIAHYDYKKDGLIYNGSKLLEEIGGRMGLDKKEINNELVQRTKMIKKLPKSYKQFFKGFQKQFYGLNYEDS